MALPLALAALPLLALLGLLVLVTLGRPVFIRQDRVSAGGTRFGMLKLRTMDHCRRRQAGPPPGGVERRHTHKDPEDPRHTRLGRHLRKWSLDELPQLWHVVSGRMSLVGPRPELAAIVERYEPWQHARHAVKPGLTGLWQVTERSTGDLMYYHVATDLAYIQDMSLRRDITILARTVGVLIAGGGGN